MDVLHKVRGWQSLTVNNELLRLDAGETGAFIKRLTRQGKNVVLTWHFIRQVRQRHHTTIISLQKKYMY